MSNSYDKIVKRLRKVIKIDSFYVELLKKLSYFNDDKSIIKVKPDGVSMSLNSSYMSITIHKKNITIFSQIRKVICEDRYVITDDSIYVRTKRIQKMVSDFGNEVCFENSSQDIYRWFSKKGIENFRKSISTVDKYYEDKFTNKRRVDDLSDCYNYNQVECFWRDDSGYVIERKTKDYFYRNDYNRDDIYFRTDVVSEKEIPDNGCYYVFDKDVFDSYMSGDSTIDDIKNNVKSKKYVPVVGQNSKN